MSLVKVQGNASGTGTFTIASPNSNTDRTLTLPDNTGTILTTATAGVPVNGPAFLAFQSSATSITNATAVKVLFDTESFDTNSNFASSRFTPTVAGYYQMNANVTINCVGTGANLIYFYKNGSDFLRGGRIQTSGANPAGMTVAAIIYMNGSTDYVEVYVFTNGGTALTEAGTVSNFSGALIRSAT
jgi:hypothetical protein